MWLLADTRFFALLAIWGLLVLGLFVESLLHRRCRERVRVRIHVNGTRGKSGVTRLIAAGLRAGGMRVAAKTTGTAPRILLPDGREEALRRRGPANIRETLAFFRRAVRSGADAVVVECMALRPDLQWALEHRMVGAHVGVITNVREDHEEVMGDGTWGVGRALARTIPEGGVLVTTPGTAEVLREAGVAIPEGRLTLVDPEAMEVSLSGFAYEVFPENVALALAACEAAGVPREAALRGMREAAPDVGNTWTGVFLVGGRRVRFTDALAANDPESTLMLWKKAEAEDGEETFVVLNARADRRPRTMQLCRALAAVHAGPFVATGDARFAARHLAAAGAGQVVAVRREACFEALTKLVAAVPGGKPVQIFAAGNTQGMDAFRGKIRAMSGARLSPNSESIDTSGRC